MDCVILAGGHAKRLWPLTKTYPKTLLPIGGKAVLRHVLDSLARFREVDRIIIAIDKRTVSDFEKFIGPLRTSKLTLSVHPEQRGDHEPTGPLKKVRDIIKNSGLDRDLLLIGGDNIFGFDLNRFRQHQQVSGSICVAIKQIQQTGGASQLGVPFLDANGVVTSFKEKPSGAAYDFISTACYVIPSKHLSMVATYLRQGKTDSLGHFIEWCVAKCRVDSFRFEEPWFDTGTRQGLLGANAHALRLLRLQGIESLPVVNGGGSIKPPVYATDHTAAIKDSHIGPNVSLGAGVRIVNSTIENSIIYDRCDVSNSKIINSVIGEGSRVEAEFEGLLGPEASILIEK